MQGATQPNLGAQIAAAIDWWRDAGVDLDFADAPAQWLTATPPRARSACGSARRAIPACPPDPAPAPALGGGQSHWPQSLAEFAPWWLAEPSLDGGELHRRVPPRGPARAELMVLVPHPEADDDAAPDGPALLSGPEGRLLDAILGAIGIAPDRVYRAAALPRHMPLPDWPALAAAGFGDLLRHHIGLVAPARVIAFGMNVLPLLGHDPAQTAAVLPYFNHEDRTIPMLGAHELRVMLTRPKSKAAFWQRWLDWTGTALR